MTKDGHVQKTIVISEELKKRGNLFVRRIRDIQEAEGLRETARPHTSALTVSHRLFAVGGHMRQDAQATRRHHAH